MWLFTDLSLWTMVHGIVLGGAAIMALSAAMFALYAARRSDGAPVSATGEPQSIGGLTVFIAAALWLTVLVGTYVLFPPYRATPPVDATDLAKFPRSLILSNPETIWLHAFAMETKEHAPWIASMLATAVAFVSVRYRWQALRQAQLRDFMVALLAICLVLVAFVAVMGVFVSKVAPLQ